LVFVFLRQPIFHFLELLYALEQEMQKLLELYQILKKHHLFFDQLIVRRLLIFFKKKLLLLCLEVYSYACKREEATYDPLLQFLAQI
jgi:hypothetical protein